MPTGTLLISKWRTPPGHPSTFSRSRTFRDRVKPIADPIKVVRPTQNPKSFAYATWLHFPTLSVGEKLYLRNGTIFEAAEWHLIFHSFSVSDLCNKGGPHQGNRPSFATEKNRKSERNSKFAICRLKEISGLLCGTFYGFAVALDLVLPARDPTILLFRTHYINQSNCYISTMMRGEPINQTWQW